MDGGGAAATGASAQRNGTRTARNVIRVDENDVRNNEIGSACGFISESFSFRFVVKTRIAFATNFARKSFRYFCASSRVLITDYKPTN